MEKYKSEKNKMGGEYVVGYNYTIVFCPWCYKNDIPLIYQHLPRTVGLQDDFQCLPSIPGHYLAQTMSTEFTRASKDFMIEDNVYQARKVSK